MTRDGLLEWIPRLQAEESLRQLAVQQAQFIREPREFQAFVAELKAQAAGIVAVEPSGGLRTMRDLAAFINQHAGGAAARAAE